MCVSVFVCHCGKPPLPVDWRLLVKGRFAYIDIPLEISGFLLFRLIFGFQSYFEFLLTSLLCIMGEIEGGGSVAVAVGISDR